METKITQAFIESRHKDHIYRKYTFFNEADAQNQFDQLFKHASEFGGTYQHDLIVVHSELGRLTRRTLYTG